YIAQGLADLLQQGYSLRLVNAPEEIDAAVDADTAVLMLTHVNYKTGEMLDMASVTEMAHARGALTVLRVQQTRDPKRKVIVSEASNFPTDLYIAQGLADLLQQGYSLRLVNAPEEIDAAVDADTAVLMLTHVNYKTGEMLDMASVTEMAHARGALTVLRVQQTRDPKRKVIVSEASNFPTDLYIAQGLADLLQQGYSLRLVNAPEEIDAAVDADTAVLMLTHVNYKTGEMLDMASVTEMAHARGALTVLRVQQTRDPKRKVIVSEASNFPTDLYIAQGLADLLQQGYSLRLV
ncbi:unnamed protein product, partial [marine sediment metagenome]